MSPAVSSVLVARDGLVRALDRRRCVVTHAIWKYAVSLADVFEIAMPEGATILTVQMQVDVPVLWAIVDPDAPRVWRQIAIIGTGHVFGADPQAILYLGTFQQSGGRLVWHLFEAFRGKTS